MAPVFSIVGLDYAGPLLCKRGNPRRPTVTKAYACVFICMATKAVHLELVSDMTTEAFLACLRRFIGRRGRPTDIFSDNGSNFQGGDNTIQRILAQEETQTSIINFATRQEIKWHFTPARAPHFGGLWEAAVKGMKIIIRKTIGPHSLTFEGLSTLLVEAEAAMNSRPLMSSPAATEDGISILTPGHFLIGRPLCSAPSAFNIQTNMKHLRRWDLLQRLHSDLWDRWSKLYLQELQRRTKWRTTEVNISTGDIVLLKDQEYGRNSWPVGIVTQIHPGSDGLTRAVSVRIGKSIYKRPVVKLVLLLPVDSQPFPGEDVQAHAQEGDRTPKDPKNLLEGAAGKGQEPNSKTVT